MTVGPRSYRYNIIKTIHLVHIEEYKQVMNMDFFSPSGIGTSVISFFLSHFFHWCIYGVYLLSDF